MPIKTYDTMRRIKESVPKPLLPAAELVQEAANYALARKPEFVIIGTGRSGSKHISEVLRVSGYPCSHEAYFTYDGPKLRNAKRGFHYRGDSSWLAVPFLPDPEIVTLHQVRHPYDVIKSFYNIGFFDPANFHGRLPYVNLAKQYFEFSEDPLQSCLRWYVEWNGKCEKITDKRYAVERLSEEIDKISGWLGKELIYVDRKVSKNTNTRAPDIANPLDDIREAIRKFPEFAELEIMAERYGYEL